MQGTEDFKSILLKKVNGYDVEEVVEEYVDVDGKMVLTKKKVTHKHIPPDATMLKLLLDNKNETEYDDLSKYTEDELKAILKKIISEEGE